MKKIIFDLDDTLYVSKELSTEREKAILNLVGNRLEEYKRLKETKTTTNSLQELGISRDKFFDVLNSVKINLKKDERLKSILNKIKSDYNLIVISNSPYESVKNVLKKLGVLEIIDEFYGADNFSKSKPAEENFGKVEKGDIAVGNNFNKDLLVPKNKGAITILISNKANPEADFTIDSIYKIEEVINSLKNH